MVSPLPTPVGRPSRIRRSTTTSNFGSSRRESHDATAFYDRFSVPAISTDAVLGFRRHPVDVIHVGDARIMDQVDDATVALVVTSPPYFAGKEYEEALGHGHVPDTYRAYLDMLADVFAQCVDKLEPGGRMAVNVANLGRRPYRSLSADIIDILQNRLRLLLRGEVIWWKGRAAGGSCAWGTFQRPGNPVLRDLTERVVIASKGRFDRAMTPRERHAADRPSTATMSRDEFLEASVDLWEIGPESANRVGHPAPFPVELPQRLIELYTYRDDLVLDPFMGSGTTAVAAMRTDRRYLGYDTDAGYVAAARRRVAQEVQGHGAVELTAVPHPPEAGERLQARAMREGRQAKELARMLLEQCGFDHVKENVRYPILGVEVSFVARDATGADWVFDVAGGFTTGRAGLNRSDTLWKALGKAAVLHEAHREVPVVLMTTDRPTPGSPGAAALRAMTGPGKAIYDVVELLSAQSEQNLHRCATGSGY
ncbi:MAG: site-specific DNA-methyltransferase [Actinomycetota bacterium]|nr:site-specific DNA-methyltransferase [Actinomycetota bacterium]